MDWSNSGFEITGDLSGDLSVVANRTDLFWAAEADPTLDGCYVNVIVDGGNPTRVKIPDGDNKTVNLVSGLQKGKHTVRVLAANSAAYGSLQIKKIKFTGTLDDAKSNNRKLHILALGDSITAGHGLYGLSGGKYEKFNQEIEQSDGYYTYAAVAARMLDAELSVVAYDGAWTQMVHGLANELTRDTAGPDWDWSKDLNDVIVINLGTNDDTASDRPNPLESAKALLDDMRAKNPNAEIIWVYGMMKSYNKAPYEEAVQYMKDKGDDKVHFVLVDPGITERRENIMIYVMSDIHGSCIKNGLFKE